MANIPDGMPEWLFWISAAVGTGIGAIIVRLGWRSTTQSIAPAPLKPEGTAFIDRVGVLVDNQTIAMLSGSIEGLGVELVAVRKEYADRQDDQNRIAERLVDEMNELRKDLRDLARAYRSTG